MAGIILSGNDVIPLTGAKYYQLCQWEYDLLVFSNPEWDDCFEIVSISEPVHKENQISIYPLPLTHQSVIELAENNSRNLSLKIHDVHGRLVLTYKFSSMRKVILERDQFKTGLYIVSLLEDDKIIEREKLIVK